MTKDERALIIKYAKLRGVGNPALCADILLDIYEESPRGRRAFYMAEVVAYIEAIGCGEIEPGQSSL